MPPTTDSWLEYVKLIVQLIGSLAWPVTIAILLFVFKKDLSSLVARIKSFKGAGWEISAEQFVAVASKNSELVAAETDPERRQQLAAQGDMFLSTLSRLSAGAYRQLWHGPKDAYPLSPSNQGVGLNWVYAELAGLGILTEVPPESSDQFKLYRLTEFGKMFSKRLTEETMPYSAPIFTYVQKSDN